jgi:hypothetical protein
LSTKHQGTGRAVVLDQPLGTFQVKEFQLPDLEPGTVLLRMELSGCCATDAHTYLGQWKTLFFRPCWDTRMSAPSWQPGQVAPATISDTS